MWLISWKKLQNMLHQTLIGKGGFVYLLWAPDSGKQRSSRVSDLVWRLWINCCLWCIMFQRELSRNVKERRDRSASTQASLKKWRKSWVCSISRADQADGEPQHWQGHLILMTILSPFYWGVFWGEDVLRQSWDSSTCVLKLMMKSWTSWFNRLFNTVWNTMKLLPSHLLWTCYDLQCWNIGLKG